MAQQPPWWRAGTQKKGFDPIDFLTDEDTILSYAKVALDNYLDNRDLMADAVNAVYRATYKLGYKHGMEGRFAAGKSDPEQV